MIPLVLLLVTGSHCDKVLDSLAELKVPTSNWASVYASDNTDYRQPVSEASAYPIAESASRSDWFESYPYQKFEEKTARMADPGILEAVGDTIGETVGSVRNGVTDFGGGIVNGALRLVGAETLREKQEKARLGFHVRGPNFQPTGQIQRDTDETGQGNTVGPEVVRQANGPEQAPLEKLRLGIRSYLDPLVDPVVDPIKNLLKSDTKFESQHDRRAQQGFPNPISGLKDFGKHVAGGFSKLTGISASSKVSNMLFPWLRDDSLEPTGQIGILPPVHNTQARHAHHGILSAESVNYAHQEWPTHAQDTELPLLPPVFIFPPAPAQVAQESDIVVQRVPAPTAKPEVREPAQPSTHVLQHFEPGTFLASRPDKFRHKIKPPPYPKKVIYPPLYPQFKIQPPPYHPNEIVDTPYPYQIMITPIFEENVRSKKQTTEIDYPYFGPDQLLSGSSRSLTKNLPQISEPTGQIGYPLPFETNDVMFYLPSPDLSTGKERARVPTEDIFDAEETLLLPSTYFDAENIQPKYKRKVSNVFIDDIDLSANEFSEVIPNSENSDVALAGTNIEIDLRTGIIDGGAELDEIEDDEENNIKALKKVRKLKPSKTINLEPEDTLVFDISQQWDDILKEDAGEISNALDTDADEAESEKMQEDKAEEELI